ncbi:MAG: hypothetical protein ABSE42_16445 [Bryobacteraceae bacterium]|jgi:hypothetical protein
MKTTSLIRTITIGITLILSSLYARDKKAPIPTGATVYVAPETGFGTFIQTAFQAERVPLTSR